MKTIEDKVLVFVIQNPGCRQREIALGVTGQPKPQRVNPSIRSLVDKGMLSRSAGRGNYTYKVPLKAAVEFALTCMLEAAQCAPSLGVQMPIALSRQHFTVEDQGCPHRPPNLPRGKSGVYLFYFGDQCLKIGIAGTESAARFVSQHYGFKAPSTLAKSLRRCPGEYPGFAEANAKSWMLNHLRRVNITFPASLDQRKFFLKLLEEFLHLILQPRFEG
jgi:hypothetical protein